MRYWVRRDSNPQCHRPRIYSPLSNRCSTNPSVLSLWKMGQERLELSILSAEASKTPMYTNSNIDPILDTCAYFYKWRFNEQAVYRIWTGTYGLEDRRAKPLTLILHKSRPRENRTLTPFGTWFWVTRVYLFRHRPKCFRE